MIWYKFSDNGPHLCPDFFLLISTVDAVGLKKLDKVFFPNGATALSGPGPHY
jgi:hypothetical protein